MSEFESSDALRVRLERRVFRERQARMHAEDLLEGKSRELYEANSKLSGLAAELETRVSERTQELADAREQAIILSEQDQLTGLPNRMCFGRALEKAVEKGGDRFALFLIDLDKFKDINDGLGHEAGDVFLQHAAKRLKSVLRQPDSVARLGGDEFAAIVRNFSTVADLAYIADRMIAAVRLPVLHGDHFVETACSIGISVFPDDSRDASDLQRYADLALYRAKAAGRATRTIFDIGMRTQYDRRRLLGAELRQAIDQRDISPWFQPIVDGATGRAVGVEALARWQHPTRGMLPPAEFLKLAEERGLMTDLFSRMLRSACIQARRWIKQGVISHLAVNVSPSQFRSGSPADHIFGIIRDLDFPPSALTVEITEDLLLFDLERARVQLEQLANGGVRIALDDFGIGYSNIGYLRRLPIHLIKLDRMLTADVCTDPKARSVLGAIVDIARALDLDLVAEGVEEQSQALWLSRLGCRYQQGFYFGRPMPESDFEALAAVTRQQDEARLAGPREASA